MARHPARQTIGYESMNMVVFQLNCAVMVS